MISSLLAFVGNPKVQAKARNVPLWGWIFIGLLAVWVAGAIVSFIVGVVWFLVKLLFLPALVIGALWLFFRISRRQEL